MSNDHHNNTRTRPAAHSVPILLCVHHLAKALELIRRRAA